MAKLQISHRCPHCREKGDFVVSQLSEVRPENLSKLSPPIWETERSVLYGQPSKKKQIVAGSQAVFLSRCPHCYNPVMFVIVMSRPDVMAWSSAASRHSNERFTGEYRIIETYPSIEPLVPNPHWPEEIREDFNEARRLLQENTRPAFILPQCRAVLDVVVRKLGAPKGNLKSQIDYLAEHAIITKPLAAWAHNLREDANALLHEGKQPATPDEVAEYVAFIELLLHVTFELPQAIEEKKARVAATS